MIPVKTSMTNKKRKKFQMERERKRTVAGRAKKKQEKKGEEKRRLKSTPKKCKEVAKEGARCILLLC